MGIVTSKDFLIGVLAGVALIVVIKKLPASVPGVTQVQGLLTTIGV